MIFGGGVYVAENTLRGARFEAPQARGAKRSVLAGNRSRAKPARFPAMRKSPSGLLRRMGERIIPLALLLPRRCRGTVRI